MRTTLWGSGIFVLLVAAAGIGSYARAENWEKTTEEQRRAWNLEYDRHGLYGKRGMVTDTSGKFLRASKALASEWPEGMTIAKVPPIIEFAPVRGIDPMYFPEDNKSLWTNWGSVTLAPNGRFYFAEGDHRGKDSHVYLWEYDPDAHDCVRVIDFRKLCGWDRLGVGDSKIHGDMGVTADGIMWILTYWDPDPQPTRELEAMWPGSHLVRFDTNTGEARDLGVLIPKAGWPQYQFDPERGILFAVSFRSEVLCYHVGERRVTYFGFPPPGISWDNRCSLLDPKTGLFWCRAMDASKNLVSFDPSTNRFTRHPEASPWRIRNYSPRRSPDGSFFWVFTKGDGVIFKFWPDTRRTELVANQWKKSGYCPRFATTEDGRYIYYMAGVDIRGEDGEYREQPLVQLDTRSGKRKVIAFVTDYYFRKYGYAMNIPFGMALSRDGGTVVINLNGAFKPRVGTLWGNPALMVVHIPASERP